MIFRERSTVYLTILPACSLDMTPCEDQYRETHAMERDLRAYFQFRINASQIFNCHIRYSYNTSPSAALISRPIQRVTSTLTQ